MSALSHDLCCHSHCFSRKDRSEASSALRQARSASAKVTSASSAIRRLGAPSRPVFPGVDRGDDPSNKEVLGADPSIQDRESPIPGVGEDYVHRPPLSFKGTSVSGGDVPPARHAIGELDGVAFSRLCTLNNRC